MAAAPILHHWTLEEFLQAWEAGAFGTRIELIDGEVWDVPIGTWHARVTPRVIRQLPGDRFEILAGSRPTGESLPEPDCWVLRVGAEPAAQLSRRMFRWAADDVPLVVEVSDETRDFDLGRKAVVYAQAGYTCYWSVTVDGIYAHSRPTPGGYGHRELHGPGDRIAVPYAPEVELDVSRLIAD